jgi:hypothetical protein
VFSEYRIKQKEETKSVILNLPSMTITEKTNVFAIPFPISPEEEEKYIRQIKI